MWSTKLEIAWSATINLISWMGWLRATECFDVQWSNLVLTIPCEGTIYGLPPKVGVIQMFLDPQTKTDRTKIANIIVAWTAGLGLSLGKWIKQFMDLVELNVQDLAFYNDFIFMRPGGLSGPPLSFGPHTSGRHSMNSVLPVIHISDHITMALPKIHQWRSSGLCTTTNEAVALKFPNGACFVYNLHPRMRSSNMVDGNETKPAWNWTAIVSSSWYCPCRLRKGNLSRWLMWEGRCCCRQTPPLELLQLQYNGDSSDCQPPNHF